MVRMFLIFSMVFQCTLNSDGQSQQECTFDFNIAFISSSCSLFNGVTVKKLKNVTRLENGIPNKYSVEFQAIFGSKSMKDFDRYYFNGLYKIPFKTKTEGYAWIWIEKGTSSDLLPFNFEKNNWYLIDHLYNHGTPSVRLFVFVNADLSLKVHRQDSKPAVN